MSANPSSAVYAKLKALGIELPPVSTPAAAYVPFVQTGNLIFMSGHIAKKDGKPWLGQFGKNMSTDEGKLAARAIAICTSAIGGMGISGGNRSSSTWSSRR